MEQSYINMFKLLFLFLLLCYTFINDNTVKPRFADTRLIWTPHFHEQFALSGLGKKTLTFSLNSTLLIQTLFL